MTDELQSALGVAAAALAGAAVGVEREWSGHASGDRPHFAGIRTFTLLGGLAGMAAWLWGRGLAVPATVIVGGAVALVVAAYVAASRRDVDGTTEVAALVVIAAGLMAGSGFLRLASGAVAVTCLLLVEKSRLHRMVKRLDDQSLRAGIHFAVLAIVVLPLLPEGPLGPFDGVRPRELWALVLLFAGLSFAGWIARRASGAQRGYRLAGVLGGIVSSTGVTLTFARTSRVEPAVTNALAAGVLAACTVMFARVVVVTALLSPHLAVQFLPYALPALVLGTLLWWRGPSDQVRGHVPPEAPEHPLQLGAALQMALGFQLVLFAVHAARAAFGDRGLVVTGAVLGLADMDALTVAAVKSVQSGAAPATAAMALGWGALMNTLLKLGFTMAIGSADFRRAVAWRLAALATITAIALALAMTGVVPHVTG